MKGLIEENELTEIKGKQTTLKQDSFCGSNNFTFSLLYTSAVHRQLVSQSDEHTSLPLHISYLHGSKNSHHRKTEYLHRNKNCIMLQIVEFEPFS